MPEKIITTDPPCPEVDDFEEYLAIDELFVDYFNSYLELPSFPEPLRFNSQTGGFEVLTAARNKLADKIKALSRAQTPKSSIYKNAIVNPSIRLPHYENERDDDDVEDIKTSFSVKCLDKEQGIQWIKEHRLPTFLRSDLFMEYRLAKLLSQIEASRSGIKLTVDQNYRPWFKQKPVVRPPTPVDYTADLMKRLKVSAGSMSPAQTEQWVSVARQVEETSVVSGHLSRPISSITREPPRPLQSVSSSRPISVTSLRNDVADSADDFLQDEDSHMKYIPVGGRLNSESSVVFAPSITSSFPIHPENAARVVPLPVKSFTQVGHVVKIDPEISDDDSDQGVGSESEEIKEEIITEDVPTKSYTFDIHGIDSYASVLVALVIKNAFQSLTPHLDNQHIDQVANLDSIIPVSPRGTPLSKLDSKLFAEAIMEHEERVLEEQDTFSRQSARKTKSSTVRISEDVTQRSDSPMKKSIVFKDQCTSQLDDEGDSLFSDETDELESSFSERRYNLADSKGFNMFRNFLKGTVGGKLTDLWMDIDKTRFSVKENKMQRFLQKIRETYLKVGSPKRLPGEILSKHQLQQSSQWTLRHLQQVQRRLVEPLLLYWAPRFLVRQMSLSSSKESKQLTMRQFRPTSSQSYPCPKTITILPLRPKSCLPRLKQGQQPTVDRGHVLSEYHRYAKPELYAKPPLLSVALSTPSSIPSYLKPKVAALTGDIPQSALLPRRPASAGPLTRQTRARFEKRKSAVVKSSDYFRIRSSRPIASPAASVTSDSTVKGSPAMESMLQALYHDTKAGWFFTQYCENSKNEQWISCIHFWFDVQEYHYLFYNDIIDQFTIERKSQMIYSTYIVGGSPEDLGISIASRKQIRLTMHPPFDELFDVAEEFALKVLIVPWNRMMGMDRESYSRVELIEQDRRLNVTAKYMGCLQRKGILKEKKVPITTEQEAIQKYEEDLWEKVPEEFRNYTFDDLIRNRIELEYFRKFLEENYVKTDLLCWLDIESFKRLPHQANEKRDEKAKEIKEKYLQKKYFFGPNSPATKDEQNEAVKAGGGWGKTLKERPPTELIVEVQKYVRKRIEKRWLPMFLATADYQERQRPKSEMSEVAEDVVLQKRKRVGEPWRLLDNRWQSSSRDLIEFRRSLANPVTVSQFRRYVSVHGEFLENDVLFWLEVQKYKDFCHAHNDSDSIENKVTQIINCFINSHIPPSIQIDISYEMAEKLMEKRKELGPYVFREAQLTVFRILFPHWNSFCEFRKTLTEEKLTKTLERQRKKKLERKKEIMKEQEKEDARREELKAQKEAETSFDLPDIASIKGSDAAGSLFTVDHYDNQLSWSYGKYVEGLDRQRMLLLMENEVKGRVPLEALPDPDYDVSTEGSDASSDTDDGKSIHTEDASVNSKGKKKRKDKVIYSTIKPSTESEITSVKNDNSNGSVKQSKRSTKNGKSSVTTKKQNDAKEPLVTVD